MSGRPAVAGIAVLLCAAVAAGTVGALAALPGRSADERLAADALWILAELEEVRTQVTTAEGSYEAGCTVLPRRRERFVDARGRLLLIEGPFARERIGGPNLPAGVFRQAYLAGCPRLLARTAGRRIRRGQDVYRGPTTFGGRPAHELVVLGPPVEVRLLVERGTLRPLGVRMGPSAEATFLP